MSQKSTNRVLSRLQRAFLLQLILIGVVTVIGVITSSLIVERLLVKKALYGEAYYFWTRRAENPEFSLPETLNLTSFLSSDLNRPVPETLRDLSPGQHRVDQYQQRHIVHVSERHGERLYLLFAGGTVTKLAFYFGVLPLILVLIIMYGFAFLAYRLSKQAVSPIARLASMIEHVDFNKREARELNLASLDHSSNSETEILAAALNHFVQRSNASIERERNFTRFASHELRTPLAVIQGSASSLELLELEGAPARAVQRIKRTSRQMGDLLNTLLLLARDERDSESSEEHSVNDVADALLIQLSKVYSNKGNRISIQHHERLYAKAPESVLSIVLGNILQNAFSYTQDGDISVAINRTEIVITDTGQGMSKNAIGQVFEPFFRENHDSGPHQHQGLGLAIVQQSCRNYGWDVSLKSEKGVGTSVTITFVS